MGLWDRFFRKKNVSATPVRGGLANPPVQHPSGSTATVTKDDDWRFQREIGYLSSSSLEIQCDAIRTLGRGGDQRAVKPILRLVTHANWNVRFQAAEALGLLKDQSAVVHIRPLLKDTETLVQCQAAIALGRLGDKSVLEQLGKFAASAPNSILQRTASEVLATLAPPPVATSAVAAPGAVAAPSAVATPKPSPASAGGAPSPASSIIQELQVAADPKKKCELIKSLGKHRGDDVLEVLVRALKDADEEVRLYAISTLRGVGDARAVEPLIEVLMTDTAHQPCYYATKALARFKTPRAIAGMVSALEKQKGDLSELAFQLGEVRAKEAVDALSKLAESSGDEMAYARRHAVMSLGNIGDRRAIPSLRKALNDKDDGVRERAQTALTGFGEAASRGSTSNTVKFFVPPHKPGGTNSEAAYNAIKRYTIQTDPATADFDERLIYAVEYKHNGKMYLAQVGQTEERTKELIHAILGCGPDLVLICTTNRGAMKGYPIFVGKDEIISVTEFAA